MKNKLLRILSLVVVTVMMATLFAGCSKTDEGSETTKESKKSDDQSSGDDTASADEGLEHVTLKFYFFGDKREKTDEVWDAIAEKYRDELNVDFEVNFIPGTDYINKLNTLSASGDDWDMNFDGSWLAYSQMVNNGAYMDITELLPEYAPNLYATYMEQGTLGAATSNGKIVALPWTMNMSQRPYYWWRSDLVDAAGLDIATDSIQTIEQLDVAVNALNDAYPDNYIVREVHKEPFLAKYELADIGFQNYVYDLNDPTCQVMPLEQTDAYKDLAMYAMKWQEDGVIKKDVLVDGLDANSLIREGLGIAKFSWHEWVFAEEPFEFEGAEVGYSLLYPDNKYADRTPLANVVALNANSKNPERVLMFLDLMETDRELYDMVQYGIEGVTYELDGEMAIYPEGLDRSTTNYMEWGGQWGLWKPQFMRPNQTYAEGFWAEEANFAALDVNVASTLNGFFPSTENIEQEVATRSQVFTEFESVIKVGLIPTDTSDEFVAQFIEAEKDAGTDVVTAELQRQVDEFLAGK